MIIRSVCAIDVENSGSVAELDNCLVEMTEFSGTVPAGMKMPATLRSAGQIQGNRPGRLKLSRGQRKPIPIFSRAQDVRTNGFSSMSVGKISSGARSRPAFVYKSMAARKRKLPSFL